MTKIEIYTTPLCPYCTRAKHLLRSKQAAFDEINVMFSQTKRREMEDRAEGRHTVPQIFIDGVGIGGCDELYALEGDGRLNDMLIGGDPDPKSRQEMSSA